METAAKHDTGITSDHSITEFNMAKVSETGSEFYSRIMIRKDEHYNLIRSDIHRLIHDLDFQEQFRSTLLSMNTAQPAKFAKKHVSLMLLLTQDDLDLTLEINDFAKRGIISWITPVISNWFKPSIIEILYHRFKKDFLKAFKKSNIVFDKNYYWKLQIISEASNKEDLVKILRRLKKLPCYNESIYTVQTLRLFILLQYITSNHDIDDFFDPKWDQDDAWDD